MNMQGPGAPAPIFNQRKRHRQAMFADVNQAGPPNKMPDLMPVGGFAGGGPRQSTFNRPSRGSFNQSSNNNQQASCNSNMGSNAGNNKSNINFDSAKPNNFTFNHSAPSSNFNQSRSTTNSFNQSTPSSNSFNRTRSTTNGFNQSTQSSNSFNQSRSTTNSFNQSRTLTNNYTRNNFDQSNNQGQNMNQSNYRGGFNQSSNGQNFHQKFSSYEPYPGQKQYGGARYETQQFQPNSSYNQLPSNFDGNMLGNSGVHTVNSFDSRFQAPSMFENTGSEGYNHGSNNPAFSNRNQIMFSNSNRVNTLQSNQNNNVQHFRGNNPQKGQLNTKAKTVQKPPEIDKSLRIVTTDIEGFKKWGQRKGAVMNLLFEVFGMVDSTVLMNQSGTGKEFVLKDGMDTMQCLFYEIDRNLPRLTRGQWHRCVGTYEGKTGKLKCVAVRPAGPEERKLAKLTMYLSNKSLERFNRAVHEQ